MKCWHCQNELEFSEQSSDMRIRVYKCTDCNAWYELRKEKPRLNAAVPVLMSEIEAPHKAVQAAA